MSTADDIDEQGGLGDLVDDGVSLVSISHLYNANISGTYKRHACLMNGYWCTKNALRHPQDIIKYLKKLRES